MQLWPEKCEKRSRLIKTKNVFGNCVWREVRGESSEEHPGSSGTPKPMPPWSCGYLTAWDSDVWALKAGSWFPLLLVQVFAPWASLSWLNGNWQQSDRVVTSQKVHSYGVSNPHHWAENTHHSAEATQGRSTLPSILWRFPGKQLKMKL